MVECVFDIGVERYTGIYLIPATHVQQKIAGRVIDVEAFKVGIRPRSHKASGKISSPAWTEVIEERGGGVPRPAEKRISLSIRGEAARRRLQNLSGSVRVRRVPG